MMVQHGFFLWIEIVMCQINCNSFEMFTILSYSWISKYVWGIFQFEVFVLVLLVILFEVWC